MADVSCELVRAEQTFIRGGATDALAICVPERRQTGREERLRTRHNTELLLGVTKHGASWRSGWSGRGISVIMTLRP